MTINPFTKGTNFEKIFTTLSDLRWHCGKHELPGTQPAKAIQVIRQHGFDIEKKTIYCPVCKDKTVHRRLVSTVPIATPYTRTQLPVKLRERILEYYKNTEAITLREMVPNQLEVDHRFPQVRWSKVEKFDPDMPDEELHKMFQLLTRQHNLWKSRYCENCKKTGERGTFIGINYFYEGNEKWDPNIPEDDEKGCIGCFWYHPENWRKSLNEKIERKNSRASK
ncbi:MAG: hypothetical protein L0196_10510 [candidate division Zixibacteria bacterium]|nr:hypothetical protein [candidate division Zixibacteria bacterium]